MLLSFAMPVFAAEGEETGIAVTELKQISSAYDLGIAADNVRLAWVLDAEARGVYQSAYQLVVRDKNGIVYDTGWVESAAQSGIKALNLQPETVYYWTVNVKDQYGNESGFAPEATFETAPARVSGGYIGSANLLRKEFTLDQPVANIERARSYIGSPSPLEIHINGEKVGDLVLSPHTPVADAETYYNTYDILPHLQDGANCVGVMLSHPNNYLMGNMGAGMLKIYYKDGTTQTIATGSDWQMTNDSPITRYGWSDGEHIQGGKMEGWDKVGYDTTGWSAAANVGSPVYDGQYHVGKSAGMIYAAPTFSGDYTIEAGLTITQGIGSIMFGKASPNPAMWQFDAVNNTLRVHLPSDWSSSYIIISPCEGIKLGEQIDVKIEIVGTTVKTSIDGKLVNTSSIGAGQSTGRVGVRTASQEDFNVDYLRVVQNGATIFEDNFDTLNRDVWTISAIGELVPAVSGTTVIDEVEPVAIWPDLNNVNTLKPFILDEALVLPTYCGMYYSNQSFSGDYSIEVDVQTDNFFGLLFGNGSSQPHMAQVTYEQSTGIHSKVKFNMRDAWGGSGITTVDHPMNVDDEYVTLRVDVVGTEVTLSVDGEQVLTKTVPAGSTSGKIGFREAAYENAKVDAIRVYQNGAVIFEDDFSTLDTAKWNFPAQDTGSGFDTTKPYCVDGVLYMPINCGTYYTSQSFSGDYTIEMEARTDNVFGPLFGNGSPNPAMWQLSGNQLSAHMPGDWSDIRRGTFDGLDATKMTKLRLDIQGNNVTATINDTIDGGTITLPDGATSGKLGFRETVNESAEVNYIRVIQNGEVIFEDNFDFIDTTKWTFPSQSTKYIVDFGKNMSGYVRVSGKLPAGTKVSVAYSELVDSLGNIFPNTTYHFPVCNYTFTGGQDVFTPHFFYTGFRYVEVSGVENIDDLDFTACFVSDEVEQTGFFESSNDRLNSIFAMYYQSQRSNMVGNYTDCPQREKQGWTGDASVTKQAASMMLADYTTAEAYMNLMKNNVLSNGQPHCILPRLTTDSNTNFDIPWASAHFTFPYYTYLQTGDTYYIEMVYDNLVKIFNYYKSIAAADGVPEKVLYGDWLGYDNQQGKINRAALGATYAYYSGSLLREMTEILGKDTTQLDADLTKMYNALQARYNKGTYWSSNTQTGNSMALDFDLVPEENHDAVVASLVKNATDWGTLRTGVLGTLSIYNALSEENYHKELLDITVTGDKCSFGYMLDNGATTLWEYWDRAYEGFNSLGANGINTPAVWDSLNHCMMGGGLTTWMFEGLGGIRSTGPAFHTITYRPGLESELTFVNSSIKTMIGQTESDWTYENGVLDWTFTVPVNATAKVVIPMEDAMVIKESGVNIFCKDANGLTYAGMEDGAYVYTAGSGTYTIHASEEAEAGSVDTAPIVAAIDAANAAKEGLLVTDSKAAEVEYGVKFVTTADLSALDVAINAAKASVGDVQTEADVANVVNTLNAAMETFKAAVQEGLLLHLNVSADNAAVPVAAEIKVNGETVAERLPAAITALVGDVITAEANVRNPVDFAAEGWTVNGEVVSEGAALNYTVAGEGDIVLTTKTISPENLALGATVTATDAGSGWKPANLTNGTLSHLEGGCWSSAKLGNGTVIAEYGPVIDLGTATTFNRFHLYPRKDGVDRPVECFPVTYTFYVSDNNADWTPVYSVQKGEVPADYAPVVVELDKAVTARYVKLGVTEINCADASNNAYVQLFELGIYNVEQVVDPNAEAAAAVDTLIEAIGEVTLDSGDAIAAARTAYDALNDEAKALVTKTAALEAAEAAYDALLNPEITDVTILLTAADEVNTADGTLTYTVSAEDMVDLATVILSIDLDENLVSEPVAYAAEGWELIAQNWKEGNLYVAIASFAGCTGDGELLTVTVKLGETDGEAKAAVVSADLTAYEGEGETFVTAILDKASVTTTITSFDTYDVNRDGVVDQLDLTRAQRHYGSDHEYADVNDDGIVDIVDLILILNNYQDLEFPVR